MPDEREYAARSAIQYNLRGGEAYKQGAQAHIRDGARCRPLTCCMPLMAAGMVSLSGHHCLMHASAPFERIVRGAWAALRGRRSAHAC